MALNNNLTVELKKEKIPISQKPFFPHIFSTILGHCLVFFTKKFQNKKYFSKVLLKQTNVYTVPTKFLLRHHQHDTHEARGQKVCKDRPQVDRVKTGFLF